MVDGYYIGLMSGTSLDSIDVAIVLLADNHCQLFSSYSGEWPEELKNRLRNLIEKTDSLDEALALDQLCAQQFATTALDCLKQTSLQSSDIVAIGCHGQTIRHSPRTVPAYSLQIGNPSTIAELTRITTVADFRSSDIAAGGQGAPLTPAFHQSLFADQQKNRIILNIGGIANLTLLSKATITGFDTGPGNRLLDDWIRIHSGKPFDHDGELARSGIVNQPLLDAMLADPYFKAPYPKSTGTDYFNLDWLNRQLANFAAEKPENIQATLSALTTWSISDQIRLVAPDCDEIIVCGGGVHNSHLLGQIQAQFPQLPVVSSENYGIGPDWIEAMAFAWLAHRTISGMPGNLPSVTGARGYRVSGGIYHSPFAV